MIDIPIEDKVVIGFLLVVVVVLVMVLVK